MALSEWLNKKMWEVYEVPPKKKKKKKGSLNTDYLDVKKNIHNKTEGFK